MRTNKEAAPSHRRYHHSSGSRDRDIWSRHGRSGTLIRVKAGQHGSQSLQQAQDTGLANSTQPGPRDGPLVITANTTEPQTIIEKARQQFLKTSEHRAILHGGRKPIHIWAERVVGIAIHRNLGTLEDELERSVRYLESGDLDLAQCLQLLKTIGQPSPHCALTLCGQAVRRIQTRWEATV